MPLTIPNEIDLDADHKPQSELWQVDIDAIIEAVSHNGGIVSGCTPTAGAGMSVDVAAGSLFNGTAIVAVTGGNQSIAAADPTNPRFDLVHVDKSTGAVGATTGTAAADPAKPDLPAGKVLVAEVLVLAAASSIVAADLVDKRGNVPTNVAAVSTEVTLQVQSGVTDVGAAAGGGSGAAVDPRDPNILWKNADDAGEGFGANRTVYAYEVDDPQNPTTFTIRYAMATTIDANDLEAVSFINIGGQWYLAVWENTGDRVSFFDAPFVERGQTLVEDTGVAPVGNWTPVATLAGNVESMRYNRWDDRLYILEPRGAGTDDNDNDRDLWRSVAGWSTSTLGALPSTTMTAIGTVVTRPQGSSPVPNANGDIDFMGPNVLLIAGVATNAGTDNDYVMYVTKRTDQDWDDVLGGTGNFPQVIGQTGQAGGSEHIAADYVNGVIWVGAEAFGGNQRHARVVVTEGPLQWGNVNFGAGAAASGGLSGASCFVWNRSTESWDTYTVANDGSSNVATTLQSALDFANDQTGGDGVDDEGGTVVMLPGSYRIDTGLTFSRRVWMIAHGVLVAGWGVSGNTGSATANNKAGVVNLVSDQPIEMVTFEDTSAANNWNGGGIVGIAFLDYSTLHDQVTTAVRVNDLQHVTVFGCAFNDIRKTSGQAVLLSPGETDAGQYTFFAYCTSQNAHIAVNFTDNMPDVEILNCFWYGNDTGVGPAAGSIGLYLRTNSCRVMYGSVQFFDRGIVIESTVGNPTKTGKQNKIIGTALEIGSGDSAASMIEVIGQQPENNIIDAVDLANIGNVTDPILIGANASATIIRDVYHPGSSTFITDNGSLTVFEGDPARMIRQEAATFTLSGVDRVIDATATLTINLPAASRRKGLRHTIINSSGAGTVTLDPDAAEQIDGLTTTTVAAGKAVDIISDGSAWYTLAA